MKRIMTFFIAAMMLLSIAGCTSRSTEEPEQTVQVSQEPTPVPTVKPTPTPAPTEEPVATEPPYRNNFNGAPLSEPYTTRPFAVMINNINVAQPQCGIGQADIIYEVLAEGGITRMMAIFSDIKNVGVIGSMRSIRTYYVDIGMSYGAVVVNAGYSQQAHQRIVSNGVNNIDGVVGSYSGSTFYRDSSRMAYGFEHSLFTTGEKLYDCAQKLEFPLTIDADYDDGLHFVEDGTPAKGEKADTIAVNFSGFKSTTFTYHADTDLYTAVQHGGNYNDGNTGNPVTFQNVLVLSATTSVIDNYGRLDVTLTGNGTGYYANGGTYVPIKWSRESLTSPFQYTLEDGSALEIGVGTSYIGIIATGAGSADFS